MEESPGLVPAASKKCEERATRKEQTRDNAAAVRASRLSGGAMLWCSRKPVTPLECALAKNSPVSALESTLTNSLDLKPFGMNRCKKGVGVPPGGGRDRGPSKAKPSGLGCRACRRSVPV